MGFQLRFKSLFKIFFKSSHIGCIKSTTLSQLTQSNCWYSPNKSAYDAVLVEYLKMYLRFKNRFSNRTALLGLCVNEPITMLL